MLRGLLVRDLTHSKVKYQKPLRERRRDETQKTLPLRSRDTGYTRLTDPLLREGFVQDLLYSTKTVLRQQVLHHSLASPPLHLTVLKDEAF